MFVKWIPQEKIIIQVNTRKGYLRTVHAGEKGNMNKIKCHFLKAKMLYRSTTCTQKTRKDAMQNCTKELFHASVPS